MILDKTLYGELTGILDDNGEGKDRVIQVEFTIELNCQKLSLICYFMGDLADLFDATVKMHDFIYVKGKLCWEVGTYGDKENNMDFYADYFTKE